MFKNAAFGMALAGLLVGAALTAGAASAEAGKKFYFSVQPQGHAGGKNGHMSACHHWKRKWQRTGRQHFLRKYKSCLLEDS